MSSCETAVYVFFTLSHHTGLMVCAGEWFFFRFMIISLLRFFLHIWDVKVLGSEEVKGVCGCTRSERTEFLSPVQWQKYLCTWASDFQTAVLGSVTLQGSVSFDAHLESSKQLQFQQKILLGYLWALLHLGMCWLVSFQTEYPLLCPGLKSLPRTSKIFIVLAGSHVSVLGSACCACKIHVLPSICAVALYATMSLFVTWSFVVWNSDEIEEHKIHEFTGSIWIYTNAFMNVSPVCVQR